jgi:hypothetical protein
MFLVRWLSAVLLHHKEEAHLDSCTLLYTISAQTSPTTPGGWRTRRCCCLQQNTSHQLPLDTLGRCAPEFLFKNSEKNPLDFDNDKCDVSVPKKFQYKWKSVVEHFSTFRAILGGRIFLKNRVIFLIVWHKLSNFLLENSIWHNFEPWSKYIQSCKNIFRWNISGQCVQLYTARHVLYVCGFQAAAYARIVVGLHMVAFRAHTSQALPLLGPSSTTFSAQLTACLHDLARHFKTDQLCFGYHKDTVSSSSQLILCQLTRWIGYIQYSLLIRGILCCCYCCMESLSLPRGPLQKWLFCCLCRYISMSLTTLTTLLYTLWNE